MGVRSSGNRYKCTFVHYMCQQLNRWQINPPRGSRIATPSLQPAWLLGFRQGIILNDTLLRAVFSPDRHEMPIRSKGSHASHPLASEGGAVAAPPRWNPRGCWVSANGTANVRTLFDAFWPRFRVCTHIMGTRSGPDMHGVHIRLILGVLIM